MKYIVLVIFGLLTSVCIAQTDQEYEVGEKVAIKVEGLCGSCVARIEQAASATEGTKKCSYDLESKLLSCTVSNKDFKIRSLHRNVAFAGHDTELYNSPDDVYEDLPGCCKYRDITEEESQLIMSGGSVGETQDIQENHDPSDQDEHETKYVFNESHEHDHTIIEGFVFELNEKGEQIPLIGANVIWEDSRKGTTTDFEGYFSIEEEHEEENLVFSYVGYSSDTVSVKTDSYIELVMSNSVMMDEVHVVYRSKSTAISRVDPIKVQSITAKELCKAACCNLSESFETNPTVDSGMTDAVTGTRKIEMLGLAGPNIQFLRENVPDIRGLSAVYGLSYIPGPWISGIYLNTGTGSVVNGFESLTGQINVNIKEPANSEKFFVNLFTNLAGRMELNANAKFDIGKKLSTVVLGHGKYLHNVVDSNVDGFVDNPLEKDLILANRWHWRNDNGWTGQFGLKYNNLNHESGQVEQFAHDHVHSLFGHWASSVSTERLEFWAKNGKVFSKRPHQSIGLQISGVYHDQDAEFGARNYDAIQKSIYGNFIFQTNINADSRYKLKLGTSIQYDNFEEQVVEQEFLREEVVPGGFLEFGYFPTDKFSLIAGIRGDHHNNFGFFTTPRLHAKYSPTENDVFRIIAGRGQRTASIFAENIGAFASNRVLKIHSENSDTPYGLNAEVAWNFGINYTKYIMINQKELVFTADFYRTEFMNQVVVDWDQNLFELNFYNLNGRSYSNSFQTQVDYEIIPRFDIRAAYRFNDVKTDYSEGLITKPLTSKHRAFINLSYETEEQLAFDLTANWIGQSRLMDTSSSPIAFRRADNSPDYFLFNAQISKTWNEVFDWYIGAENLLNFKQDNPIISADDPSRMYFDSTMIWGPIFGRMVYSGIRYRFN